MIIDPLLQNLRQPNRLPEHLLSRLVWMMQCQLNFGECQRKLAGRCLVSLPTLQSFLLLTISAGMPTFSRQNSTTSLSSYATAGFSTNGAFEPTTQWIESWLTELPLHTVLTLLDQLTPLLPSPQRSSTDTPSPSILSIIQSAKITGIEPSPIRIQYFEWSPLSLGWYESLLWSFAFTSEMQVQKGTVGVWNGTAIKLFRVETVAPSGPTLSSPRGAVDAVGSNIVSRIGNLNLRGVGGGSAAQDAQHSPATGERAERPQISRTGTGDGSRPGLIRNAII